MSNPMTCDQFNDELADYLEADVDAGTRLALEAHASTCAVCGELAADLRRLQANASSLPELAPSHDLWAGIEARIETPVVQLKNGIRGEGIGRSNVGTQRRTNRLWLVLAAAGLVAVTAGITHELTKRSAPAPTLLQTASVPTSADTVQPFHRSTVPPSHRSTVQPASLVSSKPSAEQTYDAEITRLRAVLDRRRPQLDSSTVAVVEHNLQVIDDAIAQCKTALRKDPASRFLIESLNDAFDTKIELLRTAATLPSTT